MSELNQSLEPYNNMHFSNKENFTIIMDYSNENSISLKNTKNFFFNNKNTDKEQDNIKINNNENKNNHFTKTKIEEKQNKSIFGYR